MAVFRWEKKIRFGAVDHARIVYYPRFFHMFHEAFEDWFEEALGIPYREALDGDNVGFPAVHTEADFRHPLRFGDRALVELSIAGIGRGSADFRYTVRRADDHTLCATARVVVATVDMQTLAGITLPPKYRALFEAFRQAPDPVDPMVSPPGA